jgi:hypothetical protein
VSEHDPAALDAGVTGDDIEAARLTGAAGAELTEAAIHTALDRRGIPREGRTVKVTPEFVTIDLPPGWTVEGSR